MKLVSEPRIHTKIDRMTKRVRWRHPKILERGIDQTRLAISGAPDTFEKFSFLVLGDSGTGRHRSSSPQRQVAEALMANSEGAHFVMHTGDVVYLVGSSEQYRANFIKPYREWLVGGDSYKRIHYNRMRFKLPFFPVLGNHDYYDLPWFLGLFSGITGPLRYALRFYMDFDVGWHGSFKGDAYARAFLDYLRKVPEFRLDAHLDEHYTSEVDGDRCLAYRPGNYTRLPNRYYTFRYGGVDFFALDSNTFNHPLPYTSTENPIKQREQLQARRQKLEEEKAEMLRQLTMTALTPMDEDGREDLTGDIEEIDEEIYDIDKQLSDTQAPTVDREQLTWLRDRLVASWRNPAVRGRVLLLHHPPYITEATKWFQGQTLAVRHHLRRVLDEVLAGVADIAQGRPLVDLVLSGHAHCMDYLKTGDTGHGDANITWLVCGGSGYSLRRQRVEGTNLTETFGDQERSVADSHLFLGRTGKGSSLVRPYSGARIDVSEGEPLQLTVTPVVAEKASGKWQRYCLEAIEV